MTDSLSELDGTLEPAEKTDRIGRRREIALVVMQQGRITVEDIKERFGVSGVTARADLDALAASGEVVRSHGGGIRPAIQQSNGSGYHSQTPSGEQTRLARAAIALVQPMETVMMCSGTSTMQMAALLKTEYPNRLTVITYNLQIANRLSEAPQASVIMLGGILRHPSGNFAGPHAEQMMQSLHAERCFLNTPGFTLEAGLTTSDIMEAHLNAQMIEAASEITLLAELTSFGQKSLALIADFRKIHRVICDRDAPAREVAALRELGVEVLLV